MTSRNRKRQYHVYKRKERGEFVGWEVGYIKSRFFLIRVAVFYGREALKNAKEFLSLIKSKNERDI